MSSLNHRGLFFINIDLSNYILQSYNQSFAITIVKNPQKDYVFVNFFGQRLVKSLASHIIEFIYDSC
jgi:hypothetical protein